jgi:hypothetical protein
MKTLRPPTYRVLYNGRKTQIKTPLEEKNPNESIIKNGSIILLMRENLL